MRYLSFYQRAAPVICTMLSGYAGICYGLAGDTRMAGMFINILLLMAWMNVKDQTIAEQLAVIDTQGSLIQAQDSDIAFMERLIDKNSWPKPTLALRWLRRRRLR